MKKVGKEKKTREWFVEFVMNCNNDTIEFIDTISWFKYIWI